MSKTPDKKKLLLIGGGAALGLGGLGYLAYRLMSWAAGLLGTAVDTALGLLVFLGLAALVAWMFFYAARQKKKTRA